MIDDQSSMDFAAQPAEPSKDNSNRDTNLAETIESPPAKPTRQRTTSSRSRKKTVSETTIVETTEPIGNSSADASASVAQSPAAPEPNSPEKIDTPPFESVKRARPSRRRKQAAPPVEPMTLEPAIADASEPVAKDSEVRKTAKRGGSGKSRKTQTQATKNEESLTDKIEDIQRTEEPREILDAEKQVTEAANAPEPPATRKNVRRRPSKRGSRKKSETESTVTIEPTLTEPAQASTEQITLNPPSEVEANPLESTTIVIEEPQKPKPKSSRSSRSKRTIAKSRKVEEETPTKGARLVVRQGVVHLTIDGVNYPPLIFFGGCEGEKESKVVTSEIRKAAKTGVHIHSTLIELPCPLPPDSSIYETLDERLHLLLDADTQGFVIPRIVFVPAPGWRKQYPNEVIHYSDGSTGDPSLASDRFWSEAEASLSSVVTHIRRSSYANRIIGFHLERGEWFHPADKGYDYSFANREAFRAWLKAKYKNSEPSLRAAWYDGQVQFYTVEIPPMPTSPQRDNTFFEIRKEKRWVDFLEYTSDITAERLISLSKVVKQASEETCLVSVCYGYTWEFNHTFSGHLALGKILAAPSIDIISGPLSYKDRFMGGAGSVPIPMDSPSAHGKLWISEDDTKTHLAGRSDDDDYNPRMESRFATQQAHLRLLAKSLIHNTGVSWMDLWGEGWLDSDEIWGYLSSYIQRIASAEHRSRHFSPEVVVLLDERSLPHIQRKEPFLTKILQGHRDLFQRCGASVGYYLQGDVMARYFPVDAKLYIFLTPYRLPAEHRNAIREKIKHGGKTLVWMYAPGIFEEKSAQEERANEVTDIPLRHQSWGSESGSKIINANHPITQNLAGKMFGEKERINPSFYAVEERGVVVLAEYQQSGLPSLVVRKMDDWNSVFCGETVLTRELLHGLCRFAGVHIYSDQDDILTAGNGWISIHTQHDGKRSLRFPVNSSVYDLVKDHMVAKDVNEYTTFLKGKTTYIFYHGTTQEIKKLGFANTDIPEIAPPAVSEEPKTPFLSTIKTNPIIASESTTTIPGESDILNVLSLTEKERKWLEEDLKEEMGEIVPDNYPEEMEDDPYPDELTLSEDPEEETPDPAVKHKRRRRRGGRGRGKKRDATHGSESTPME